MPITYIGTGNTQFLAAGYNILLRKLGNKKNYCSMLNTMKGYTGMKTNADQAGKEAEK